MGEPSTKPAGESSPTPQAPDRSRAGVPARSGKGSRVHVLAGEWLIRDYTGTPIPVARFKCGAMGQHPALALGEVLSCANCKRLVRDEGQAMSRRCRLVIEWESAGHPEQDRSLADEIDDLAWPWICDYGGSAELTLPDGTAAPLAAPADTPRDPQ